MGGERRLGDLLADCDPRWIFIVGCNNSGSSLLQRLFFLSGQASTLPLEGQKHTRILPRATRKGYNRIWSEYAPDLVLPPELAPTLGPRLAYDWLTSLNTPLHPVIVEKTPANVLRMPFLQACFPNSRFIGLVRNGYAVAEGIRRKAGHSLERAAAHWAEVQRIMGREAHNVDQLLTIRYEDLVDDFAATATSIADFTGLPRESFLDLDGRPHRLQTIRGDKPQRLRNMNHASLSQLSSHDLDVIEQNAGPELIRHGYQRPSAGPNSSQEA